MADYSTRSMDKTAGTRMRHGALWAGILALVLAGGLAVGAVAEEGTHLAPVPTTGMQSGKVTDKHDTSIKINGQEYALHPKVTLADDQEVEAAWEDFKKGSQVWFHLKQEKIDYLILELPR